MFKKSFIALLMVGLSACSGGTDNVVADNTNVPADSSGEVSTNVTDEPSSDISFGDADVELLSEDVEKPALPESVVPAFEDGVLVKPLVLSVVTNNYGGICFVMDEEDEILTSLQRDNNVVATVTYDEALVLGEHYNLLIPNKDLDRMVMDGCHLVYVYYPDFVDESSSGVDKLKYINAMSMYLRVGVMVDDFKSKFDELNQSDVSLFDEIYSYGF